MSEEKFQGRYRIPSARLAGYDYGSSGMYFITICTQNRQHFFGAIPTVETRHFASHLPVGTPIQIPPVQSPSGSVPSGFVPSGFVPSGGEPSGFVPSGGETRGIASLRVTEIGKRAVDCWSMIPTFFPFVHLDAFQLMPNHLHGIIWIDKPDYIDWKPGTFGPQSQNMASIIRGFKSAVKAYATTTRIEFSWQPRYYDRVIRNDDELNRIRQYIENNPINWHNDLHNEQGIYM